MWHNLLWDSLVWDTSLGTTSGKFPSGMTFEARRVLLASYCVFCNTRQACELHMI